LSVQDSPMEPVQEHVNSSVFDLPSDSIPQQLPASTLHSNRPPKRPATNESADTGPSLRPLRNNHAIITTQSAKKAKTILKPISHLHWLTVSGIPDDIGGLQVSN
jgi:hypothetical protein